MYYYKYLPPILPPRIPSVDETDHQNLTTKAAISTASSITTRKSTIEPLQPLPPVVDYLYEILSNQYLNLSINLCGIILNTLCIITFVLILYNKRYEGHMYKYLLMKSYCDSSIFCSLIFEIFYKTSMSDSYVLQVWFIYFGQFASWSFVQASGCFEIAATFDCFITINKKLQCCMSRVAFYIICSLIMILNACSNIYHILVRRIGFDEDIYYPDSNVNFLESDLYRYWSVSVGIFRDGVIFVGVIVVNVLILVSLRQVTQRRRRMHGDQATPSTLVTNAEKAERNKLIMISLTGVNYAIGHLPYLVTLIPNSNQSDMTKNYSLFWTYFGQIGKGTKLLSVTNNRFNFIKFFPFP